MVCGDGGRFSRRPSGSGESSSSSVTGGEKLQSGPPSAVLEVYVGTAALTFVCAER